MRKSLLLLLAVVSSVPIYARHTAGSRAAKIKPTVAPRIISTAKTTATGDTITLSNIASTDTLTAYSYSDTAGYVTGTNAFGDRGFAERYYFNGADSSMKVIGVMAHFTGKVNPASAHKVNFKVWNTSYRVAVTEHLAYSDFPNITMDTLTVPFTSLGIGTTTDTIKTFMFPHGTDTLNGPFFVGYDMDYHFTTLAGDTIGLVASKNGSRTSPLYEVEMHVDDFGDTVRDTIIMVQNATQWSDNNWHENYTDNDSMFNNLAIYPIVVIGAPTGVNTVTRRDLTLAGAYPNPTTGGLTAVKFTLANNADVTLQLMDPSGKLLHSQTSKKLTNGEHVMFIPVDALPAGTYLYSITTSTGDGLASQLTIIK